MVGGSPASGGDMAALANSLQTGLHNILNQNRDTRQTFKLNQDSLLGDSDSGSLLNNKPKTEKSWQMHIYASRQNVHITVCRPPAWTDPITEKQYGMGKNPHRTVALSMSAGNIGFRKAGRKHYDSAFQLAGYVFTRMRESGIAALIEELEVSMRGFGAGREAVSRALLGTEGKQLRHKVTRVSDATRLKFGGTRSRKPRRLG
jgi:small subunit ribosomal protein S11